MSATQSAGPTPEQVEIALANVTHGIYAPRFFDKLASFGLVPQDDAERASLLELGFKLAELNYPVPEEPAPAPVAKPTNKYAAAIDALDRVRYSSHELAAHDRQRVAAEIISEPTLYASTMVLKAAEEAQAASQAQSQTN